MARTALRWLLALFYFTAGVIHLVHPAIFLSIMPGWVPAPDAVVLWTGVAEIIGAIALAQPVWPRLMQAAGWGLAVYALCVWPANFEHMRIDMANANGGAGLGYHVPRLCLQPVFIWLALWTGGVTDWPWRQRGKGV